VWKGTWQLDDEGKEESKEGDALHCSDNMGARAVIGSCRMFQRSVLRCQLEIQIEQRRQHRTHKEGVQQKLHGASCVLDRPKWRSEVHGTNSNS